MMESQPINLAPALDTGRVIGIIIFLVLLIIGAYFLTKYVERKTLTRGMKQGPKKHGFFGFAASGTSPQPGHLVSVVDRIVVDRDKTLLVVEFEKKYYLLGIAPQGIECLGSADVPLQEETASEETEAAEAPQAGTAGPAQRTVPQPGDGSSFGERFRYAFGTVLKSYLPRSMRGTQPAAQSFDEQLRAQMQRNARADEKSGGKDESAE